MVATAMSRLLVTVAALVCVQGGTAGSFVRPELMGRALSVRGGVQAGEIKYAKVPIEDVPPHIAVKRRTARRLVSVRHINTATSATTTVTCAATLTPTSAPNTCRQRPPPPAPASSRHHQPPPVSATAAAPLQPAAH